MFPEMMELRRQKTKPPQLVILGSELMDDRILAYGFISTEPIRKGRRFWFEKWRVEVTEALPSNTAAIFPVTMQRPLELEIIKWPT